MTKKWDCGAQWVQAGVWQLFLTQGLDIPAQSNHLAKAGALSVHHVHGDICVDIRPIHDSSNILEVSDELVH